MFSTKLGLFPDHRDGRIGVSCRPPIAYSRVDTGRNPSAVPSSSNFPASHLGSKLGLIAQSYRVFSSPPFGQPTRLPGGLLPPSPPAEQATARQDQAGKARTGDGAGHSGQLTANFA